MSAKLEGWKTFILSLVQMGLGVYLVIEGNDAGWALLGFGFAGGAVRTITTGPASVRFVPPEKGDGPGDSA